MKSQFEKSTRSTFSQELLSQYSSEKLKLGLGKRDRITYSENGNRTQKASEFLNKARKAARLSGVTRIANVSELSVATFPVYQSCRPNLIYHSFLGQNTGSQGKGLHKTQAQISCLMEAVEAFCAEPRNPFLIRGSYNFLKNHHLVFNPCLIARNNNSAAVDMDQALMWTSAYSVGLKTDVLVPAECIYFPFLPNMYETPSLFPQNSNGLASGATYLEAVIHGLYELIERHYIYCFEEGKVNFEAFYENEFKIPNLHQYQNQAKDDMELQLYSVQIPGFHNLPMIMSMLVGDYRYSVGWGCSQTIQISAMRAISEAYQGIATNISGAREDMVRRISGNERFAKTPQPEERTLSLSAYKRAVLNRKFTTLLAEYQSILRWLQQHGFNHVLISNLTRIGIDLPIVKILVPGLEAPDAAKNPCQVTFQEVTCRQYSNQLKS